MKIILFLLFLNPIAVIIFLFSNNAWLMYYANTFGCILFGYVFCRETQAMDHGQGTRVVKERWYEWE